MWEKRGMNEGLWLFAGGSCSCRFDQEVFSGFDLLFFVNMGLLFNAASKGSEFFSISISKARMLSVQHSSFPSMVFGSYFLLDGLYETFFFVFSPLEV